MDNDDPETEMRLLFRRSALALMLAILAGCTTSPSTNAAQAVPVVEMATLYPNETPSLRALISSYAALYQVPEKLVHRVVQRESNYNPRARNGPYYGLMQIHPQTARTMGHRGKPSGLLDAETNLKYAVKYLRGAWLLSGGSFDRAVGWYARGYYYEAKRRGMLKETGLR